MRKIILPFPLLIILAAFFSFVGTSCSNRAMVGVPAQQEFVLGGSEWRSFKVDLKNMGEETVEVRAVNSKTGVETQSLQLAGQQEASLFVKGNEKVLLGNPGQTDINVKVNLNKTVRGMGYQAISSEPE